MEPVLIQAIDRLEAVLAKETGALRSGEAFDLAETSARKNQCLLELSRMSRGLDPTRVSPDMRARLEGLKAALERNQRILRLHVQASEEIAGVIARSIEHAESDGTYGDSVNGVRRAR